MCGTFICIDHTYLGGGNSNILYVHPYLGKWSNLTSIFQMGWNHQPDTYRLFLWMPPPYPSIHLSTASTVAFLLSISLTINQFIYQSIKLSINLSIYLIYLFVFACIDKPRNESIYDYIRESISIWIILNSIPVCFVYLSICICLSVYISRHPKIRDRSMMIDTKIADR